MALQLYLPDHHDPTTPLMVEIAAVRWSIQQKCGLEFITMPSGDQARLRRYVTTLQTISPQRSLLSNRGIPGYRSDLYRAFTLS